MSVTGWTGAAAYGQRRSKLDCANAYVDLELSYPHLRSRSFLDDVSVTYTFTTCLQQPLLRTESGFYREVAVVAKAMFCGIVFAILTITWLFTIYSLTITTLWANSANVKKVTFFLFFLFFPENRIRHLTYCFHLSPTIYYQFLYMQL